MIYNTSNLEKEITRDGKGWSASFYNNDGMSSVYFERNGESLEVIRISKAVMHCDAEVNEMCAFLEGFAASRDLTFEVGALDV